jgi:hypothetical protein
MLACRTEAGNFANLRLEDLLAKLKARDKTGRWGWWEDAEGHARSEDVSEAINYLHRRGYVYRSRNPHVEPTPKAVFVLQAAKMWPLCEEDSP